MMEVKDVMTRDVITCAPEDKIEDIVRIMGEKKVSGLPVLDQGRLAGIVTEEDIMKLLAVPESSTTLWLPSPFEVLLEIPLKDILSLRKLQQSYTDVGQRLVKDIMSKGVITIPPDAELVEAATLMVRHQINRLPVVEKGRLVGIITRDDIIQGIGGQK